MKRCHPVDIAITNAIWRPSLVQQSNKWQKLLYDSLTTERSISEQITKHLGLYSSTDHPDRYSNIFLNAYINHHAHTEYLKMIEVYSPLGIWHVFLYSISTNIYHFRSMKYRQYA